MTSYQGPSLELISFPTCPYVQRSVISLLHKGIPFKRTNIDLSSPPEWFLEISPLGKVPVLRVGDNDVIFESAVISEYIDETTAPQMHPQDPLPRARNRSWIEFISTMLVDFYALSIATDSHGFSEAESTLNAKLENLNRQLQSGPFFNGPQMSLVDAAAAPLLLRLEFVRRMHPLPGYEGLDRIQGWCRSLLSEPAVRQSSPPDFDERMMTMLRSRKSVLVC